MSIENFVHRYSEQDSLSQKSIQWRLKGLFEASGLQGTRESNMAANSSSGPRIQPVHGKLTTTATKQERENTMRKVLLSMALAVVARLHGDRSRRPPPQRPRLKATVRLRSILRGVQSCSGRVADRSAIASAKLLVM